MQLEKKEGDRFEKLVELPDADKKIYYKVGGTVIHLFTRLSKASPSFKFVEIVQFMNEGLLVTCFGLILRRKYEDGTNKVTGVTPFPLVVPSVGH